MCVRVCVCLYSPISLTISHKVSLCRVKKNIDVMLSNTQWNAQYLCIIKTVF